MRSVTARRNLGVVVRVDVYQPGGVALIDNEVAERRGQALGVVEPCAVRTLERLRTDFHEFNADYRRVTTDLPYDKVLADFLTERAGRGKR